MTDFTTQPPDQTFSQASPEPSAQTVLPDRDQFRISPLIRLTLLSLYLGLTLPLPVLAHTTAAPIHIWRGVMSYS